MSFANPFPHLDKWLTGAPSRSLSFTPEFEADLREAAEVMNINPTEAICRAVEGWVRTVLQAKRDVAGEFARGDAAIGGGGHTNGLGHDRSRRPNKPKVVWA